MATESMSTTNAPSKRIVSLDQFRGYTVAGMFLVNFVGSFEATHYLLKHHTTFCSYADTIMPHFFFAVGFAFRLTFGRRIQTQGATAAYLRVVRRLLGLVLVALVVYTVGRRAESWNELVQMGAWEAIKDPLKNTWFQTLMHIAVTSLWILPLIRASAGARILYTIASAGLQIYLSQTFYFYWVHEPPGGIDGGPLGFLTWTIPTIVGTLACDAVVNASGRPRLLPLILWSAALMALGYVFSCGTRLYDVPEQQAPSQDAIPAPQDLAFAYKLAKDPVVPSRARLERGRTLVSEGKWSQLLAEPPFVPPPHPKGNVGGSQLYRKWNYWMMSQQAGTISYLTFSAGLSLAVYVLFYIFCDLWGLQIGLFRTFGTNALAGYVLHELVGSAVKPFIPRDAPGWYVWTGFAVFFGITYLFVRTLEKNNIYIKL